MNNNFFRKYKKNLKALLPLALSILFAATALGIVIYYIIGPAEGYFHSDCTDSLLWAEAALDSGSVFNPYFYYAGMLPFSAQVWLVPLIQLFGVTMTAHVIGMVIFALLFFASVIFFCRSMQWSYSFSFFTAGSLMLMLSSSEKMREIMWEHVIYYSLGLLILFTGMGLMLRMCRSFENGNKKKGYAYASVFFIFMLLGATNGLQCLAIYTLPMLAAIAAYAVFNSKEKIISAHNWYYLLSAFILVVSTALGLLLLSYWKGGMIAKYANGFSLMDGVNNWMNNLLKLPISYITLFGAEIADGASLAEKETLFMLIRLAAALLTVLLPLVLLFNYKKIEERETKLVLWVHFAVSAVIIFGFVCGRLAAGNWRLIPMVGTGIMASFTSIRFMFRSKEYALSFRRVGALLALIPLLCSFVNFSEISHMPHDYGRDDGRHQLAEFLEKKGLEYGYAEFWTAHATTIISDSKVKLRPIKITAQNGIIPYEYQINAKWYVDQSGVEEYFVVMSSMDYATVVKSEQWSKFASEHYKAKYNSGEYMIFVFDANPFYYIQLTSE